MKNQTDPGRVAEVCRRYPVGMPERIRPFGDGHINETFLAESAKGRFICQRLQRNMDPERLKYNYSLYSEVLENAGIRCPKWLQRVDTAEFFYTDEEGERWRMYPYLEGEVPAPPLTKETLYACGAGLARFHQALQDLPKKPSPVYPMHHDLAFYLKEYRDALGSSESASLRDQALEEWIEAECSCFLNLERGQITVIHGDPKLENILLQGRTVTAFVDLDTVMPGSALEDLADLIRSAVSAQNRTKPDEVIQEAVMSGYFSVGSAPLLSPEEARLLPEVVRKLYYELALRYYTDHLLGGKHFHEKYPGYLLEKARKNRHQWQEI